MQQRYEHKLVCAGVTADSVNKTIQKYTSEGWEIVGMSHMASSEYCSTTHYVYICFKRLKDV